jgi:hypothetical protein
MIEAAAPLVRRGRRNARYTAISNVLIDHPTLSPEARIVLIYLLSRPDNWELQIPDIRRLLGTGPKACGRNKTYEVIKELKNCAHVIAVEELRSGRFFRLTYYVFDEPHHDPDGFAEAMREGRDYENAEPGESGKQTRNSPSQPHPGIRDTAPSPHPEIRDTENRHIKKNGKKQNTDPPPPPPVEADCGVDRQEGGGFEFSKIWDVWPEAERPDHRRYAERLFQQLTADERRKSIQFATAFRMVRAGQGAFAPMIPYLRERQFLEFDGAPEIDREGYFIIKPPSPEWAAWIEQTRGMYGEKGVEAARKTGFFLRRTRWPEGHPLAESWRDDRGETGQRSRTSRAPRPPFRTCRHDSPAPVSANGGR